MKTEVSNYFLTDEINGNYQGNDDCPAPRGMGKFPNTDIDRHWQRSSPARRARRIWAASPRIRVAPRNRCRNILMLNFNTSQPGSCLKNDVSINARNES